MSDERGYEARVAGDRVAPVEGWRLEWVDRQHGVARLAGPGGAASWVLVEGSGTDWVVTLRGRRVPVAVQSWRERLLAEAETDPRAHGGPVAVRATLPGLIVAVQVEPGSEVAEGDPLLTIEAMKMQNEIRAPRAGRVLEVAVAPGQAVSSGASLVTLE